MTNSRNEIRAVDPSSPACINLQMLRSSHYVLKAYDEAYRPYGVRATQMPVLGAVARRQPVTIRDIAEELETERSVMSRKLQVMEKSGWVQQHPTDSGKEKSFVLTEQGERLIDDIQPVRLKVQQRLMTVLSDEEMNLLLTLCNKLKAAA